jgi:hypothetical protein
LDEIEFVGHKLTGEYISFTDTQKEKVLQFSLPTTVKSLQSFLGLVNYFRDHIRNHSSNVYPLQKLIPSGASGRTSIVWTEELKQIFNDVKKSVEDLQELYFLSDDGEIRLYTDACDYGIGAYLCQIQDGIEKPISFISHTLSSVQQRWSTIEQECYAIVYSFKHLAYLIQDVPFVLLTDHRNLLYMNTAGSSKVLRWKLEVQNYDFKIMHIEGKRNVVADSFSRLCPSTIEALNALKLVPDLELTKKERSIISKVHNIYIGHHGVDRTVQLLTERDCKMEGLRNKVNHFVRNCPLCQRMSELKVPILAHRFVSSTFEPMQRLAIDAIGPLPPSDEGYKYILVIIDCFTRWIELFPMKDVSAIAAADSIVQFAGRYGFAKQLVSDRGSQFVNSIISELMQLLTTEHSFSIAYSKEENSIVERANKEVLRHLRAILLHSEVIKDWKQAVPFVQRIFNASVNRSIGVSPAQLVFGKSIDLNRNIIQDETFNSPSIDFNNLSQYSAKLLKQQKLIISVAQATQARRNSDHLAHQPGEPTIFAIDSWVMVSYPKNRMKLNALSKLDSPWYGPMKIISKNVDKYELYNPATGKHETVHVARLKQFIHDSSIIPEDVAIRNNEMYVVENILSHQGSINTRKDLKFQVKWRGTSDTTWEPWENLRDNIVVHAYLRSNRMSSIIPARYRSDDFKPTDVLHSEKISTGEFQGSNEGSTQKLPKKKRQRRG